MAQSLAARVVGIAGADPLFARIRQEAEEAIRREPEQPAKPGAQVIQERSFCGRFAFQRRGLCGT